MNNIVYTGMVAESSEDDEHHFIAVTRENNGYAAWEINPGEHNMRTVSGTPIQPIWFKSCDKAIEWAVQLTFTRREQQKG